MKNLILRDPNSGALATYSPEDFKSLLENSVLKQVFVDLASVGEAPSLQEVGTISLVFQPATTSTSPHQPEPEPEYVESNPPETFGGMTEPAPQPSPAQLTINEATNGMTAIGDKSKFGKVGTIPAGKSFLKRLVG